MTSPSREIPRQCHTLGCKAMVHTVYCPKCQRDRKAKR